MKRSIVFLCLLLGVFILHAQLIDLASYIMQSAVTPENELLLRIYSVDEMTAFNIEAVTFQDGTQNTALFVPVNVSEQKVVITAPDDALPQIGFRVESEYINMVIPWEIATTQATQAGYYIRSGVSPEGIINGVSDSYVDLRSQSFSLTSTSINVMLQNEAGSYPSSLSQMYLYGSMLLNADRLLELDIDFENFDFENIDPAILAGINAYAMIHSGISVPMFIQISSGIYKLPLSMFADPESIDFSILLTLSPIGSIVSTTNGGGMQLRANYSEFVNDEEFGAWPNLSNCLIAIPFIIKVASILPTPTFAMDAGLPTVIFCSPYEVLPQTDTSVNISLGTMLPLLYEVQYTSSGGFYPYFARFVSDTQGVIDGVSYGYDFSQTATFYFASESPLGDGMFEFSADNVNIEFLTYTAGGCYDEVCVPRSGLLGNYPNPFNPSTTIHFALVHSGQVSLEVFNIRGQKVKTLVDEVKSAGEHNVVWDGYDDSGRGVVSGIYFYRMVGNDIIDVKKMLMVK